MSSFRFQVQTRTFLFFYFVGNHLGSFVSDNVLLLLCQVYTRLHFISSDPGAEAGHRRRLRVRVCPERLLALPHVGHVRGEPSQAELGAGALHHSVSHHEVSGGRLICFYFVSVSERQFTAPPCLCSFMFLLVIATAYLEAQSIWEPFKKRVSVESNSTLETGRPFNLREIVQIHSDSKWVYAWKRRNYILPVHLPL